MITNTKKFGLLRKVLARFHLRFMCPRCSEEKKKMRDIDGSGECFWNKNWVKGNYNIPLWMGYRKWVEQYLKKEK